MRAKPKDVPSIQVIVDAAYSKYIKRIGKPPAPMTVDYHDALKTRDIFVLRDADDKIVGSIAMYLDPASSSMKIENLVVDPTAQGRGYARRLMDCAEDIARLHGCAALTLHTNVKMYENFGIYLTMGFSETARGIEDGYERVYYRKNLL